MNHVKQVEPIQAPANQERSVVHGHTGGDFRGVLLHMLCGNCVNPRHVLKGTTDVHSFNQLFAGLNLSGVRPN